MWLVTNLLHYVLRQKNLLENEAAGLLTYSAEDERRMYSYITPQTRKVQPTQPLILTTFTPTPVAPVDIAQRTSARVSSK